MSSSPSSNAVVICGEALEELTRLPDASFDSLVTDPPAGISFMGKTWDRPDGTSPNGGHVKDWVFIETRTVRIRANTPDVAIKSFRSAPTPPPMNVASP